MENRWADATYEATYRSWWGEESDPIGHLVIRRLDDHAVVAEVPAYTEAEALALTGRVEAEIHGPAEAFELSWGIVPESPEDADAVQLPSVEEEVADHDRGREVKTLEPGIGVFPEPSEVFAPEQPWLAQVMHPLLAIDLSLVDPNLSGTVYLVNPIEPFDGLLGENTQAHANEFTGLNWISFQLDGAGRYSFLGVPALFEALTAQPTGADLAEFYTAADAEFAATKVRWHKYGTLTWGDYEDPTVRRKNWGEPALVDQLGGDPGWGNWTSFPPPAAFQLDETNRTTPVLRFADGRPFVFIARTAGYPWREEAADAVLLFFEPVSRTAVLTFDWS